MGAYSQRWNVETEATRLAATEMFEGEGKKKKPKRFSYRDIAARVNELAERKVGKMAVANALSELRRAGEVKVVSDFGEYPTVYVSTGSRSPSRVI